MVWMGKDEFEFELWVAYTVFSQLSVVFTTF